MSVDFTGPWEVPAALRTAKTFDAQVWENALDERQAEYDALYEARGKFGPEELRFQKRALNARIELIRSYCDCLPEVAAYNKRMKKLAENFEDAPQFKSLAEKRRASELAIEISSIQTRFRTLTQLLKISPETIPWYYPEMLLRIGAVLVGVILGCTILLLISLPLHLLMRPVLKLVGFSNPDVIAEVSQRGFGFFIRTIGGIRVRIEGSELLGTEQKILMYTHSSNLDVYCIGPSLPGFFRYIAKKELFYIPFFGWALWAFGHVSLNRKNRAQAVDSLKSVAETVKRRGISIAIAPEGTRTTTGHIRDFKKGGFHLAKQSGAAISPLLLMGAYELWPPGQALMKPGVCTLRTLPLIPITSESTPESLRLMTYRRLLHATMIPPDQSIPPSSIWGFDKILTGLIYALVVSSIMWAVR